MKMTNQRVDLGAAVRAGLLAGLLFLILEMILVPVVGEGSPWGPPRMIGAILLGKGVLPPPADFAAVPFLAAIAVHFSLSVIYAIVLAALIKGFDTGVAILIGLVFGLALYFVNFYVLTAAFPWFAMARNPITVFTHLVFGACGGWAYLWFRRPAALPVPV